MACLRPNHSVDFLASRHRAVKIFGANKFSFEIMKLQIRCTEQDESGAYISSAHCLGTVSAHGSQQQEFGFGTVKNRSKAVAEGDAMKQAVTDCRKRCLMAFGPYLGSSLKDKKYAEKIAAEIRKRKRAGKAASSVASASPAKRSRACVVCGTPSSTKVCSVCEECS